MAGKVDHTQPSDTIEDGKSEKERKSPVLDASNVELGDSRPDTVEDDGGDDNVAVSVSAGSSSSGDRAAKEEDDSISSSSSEETSTDGSPTSRRRRLREMMGSSWARASRASSEGSINSILSSGRRRSDSAGARRLQAALSLGAPGVSRSGPSGWSMGARKAAWAALGEEEDENVHTPELRTAQLEPPVSFPALFESSVCGPLPPLAPIRAGGASIDAVSVPLAGRAATVAIHEHTPLQLPPRILASLLLDAALAREASIALSRVNTTAVALDPRPPVPAGMGEGDPRFATLGLSDGKYTGSVPLRDPLDASRWPETSRKSFDSYLSQLRRASREAGVASDATMRIRRLRRTRGHVEDGGRSAELAVWNALDGAAAAAHFRPELYTGGGGGERKEGGRGFVGASAAVASALCGVGAPLPLDDWDAGEHGEDLSGPLRHGKTELPPDLPKELRSDSFNVASPEAFALFRSLVPPKKSTNPFAMPLLEQQQLPEDAVEMAVGPLEKLGTWSDGVEAALAVELPRRRARLLGALRRLAALHRSLAAAEAAAAAGRAYLDRLKRSVATPALRAIALRRRSLRVAAVRKSVAALQTVTAAVDRAASLPPDQMLAATADASALLDNLHGLRAASILRRKIHNLRQHSIDTLQHNTLREATRIIAAGAADEDLDPSPATARALGRWRPSPAHVRASLLQGNGAAVIHSPTSLWLVLPIPGNEAAAAARWSRLAPVGALPSRLSDLRRASVASRLRVRPPLAALALHAGVEAVEGALTGLADRVPREVRAAVRTVVAESVRSLQVRRAARSGETEDVEVGASEHSVPAGVLRSLRASQFAAVLDALAAALEGLLQRAQLTHAAIVAALDGARQSLGPARESLSAKSAQVLPAAASAARAHVARLLAVRREQHADAGACSLADAAACWASASGAAARLRAAAAVDGPCPVAREIAQQAAARIANARSRATGAVEAACRAEPWSRGPVPRASQGMLDAAAKWAWIERRPASTPDWGGVLGDRRSGGEDSTELFIPSPPTSSTTSSKQSYAVAPVALHALRAATEAVAAARASTVEPAAARAAARGFNGPESWTVRLQPALDADLPSVVPDIAVAGSAPAWWIAGQITCTPSSSLSVTGSAPLSLILPLLTSGSHLSPEAAVAAIAAAVGQPQGQHAGGLVIGATGVTTSTSTKIQLSGDASSKPIKDDEDELVPVTLAAAAAAEAISDVASALAKETRHAVLDAGAVQTGVLRTVTARHLAVAAQSLAAAGSSVPIWRTCLLGLAPPPPGQAAPWEAQLTHAKRVLEEASDECLSKVAGVVGALADRACAQLERMVAAGVYETHARAASGSSWPSAAAPAPKLCDPLQKLADGVARLARVIAPVLQGEHAREVGGRVAVLLSSQLPVHLSAIDTGLDGGADGLTAPARKWMAVEVLAIAEAIQRLPGCSNLDTDSGAAAVASLRRWVMRHFGPQGAEAQQLWDQAKKEIQ